MAQRLGQHYHVKGTPMDGSEIDTHNRTVFEEVYQIIKMAWTQDTIEYNSDYYSIPQPYEEGIRRWPARDWTRKYGAPGELDDEGVVRRVSVVPKPYQQPHPPLWQAFSVSERMIRWTARANITPWILTSLPENFVKFCRDYQEEAATVGRELALGESVGAARGIFIGKTREEAFEFGVRATGVFWGTFAAAFGFIEVFRNPGEEAPSPLTFERPEDTFQRMIDHDYALCGAVDDVKRKLDKIRRVYGDGALEWFCWQFPQGFVPRDEARWQLETFGNDILSEFKD